MGSRLRTDSESARPASGPAERIRRRVARGILSVTSGSGAPRPEFSTPVGDPGLFGPQSVCWRVHSDFTAMMVGGVSALLLQALHPLAMAGVWDHSGFREDVLGRLRRTAVFVSGTTYASCDQAEALIQRVRRIHERVRGTAPDGRAYRADDPDLLTWVHVAEMRSFLSAYLRYMNPGLSDADQDRYFDEVARVALALGAPDVPRSRASVERYIEDMRPQLVFSERTRDVLELLRSPPTLSHAAKPMARLFVEAGVDLLPDWAQAMIGAHIHARRRRAVVRPGIRVTARVFRWGLRVGAAELSRRRVQG